MLHYAVVFFIIALIAAVFGFGGIAAGAALGWLLLRRAHNRARQPRAQAPSTAPPARLEIQTLSRRNPTARGRCSGPWPTYHHHNRTRP